MRSILPAAFAVASSLCLSSASAVPTLGWAPGPAVVRLLAGGGAWAEALPATGGAALIHAAVDIPAPARVVWAVMTDCRMAARLVVSVTSCKVLAGDAQKGWDVREQVTRGSLFLPQIHNVLRADYQPYSLIRFRKAGGDLKAEDGEWRFEPLAGGAGTRVLYVNLVAVDILAPAPLVRAGMRRDMPKVMVNIRRESVALARKQG